MQPPRAQAGTTTLSNIAIIVLLSVAVVPLSGLGLASRDLIVADTNAVAAASSAPTTDLRSGTSTPNLAPLLGSTTSAGEAASFAGGVEVTCDSAGCTYAGPTVEAMAEEIEAKANTAKWRGLKNSALGAASGVAAALAAKSVFGLLIGGAATAAAAPLAAAVAAGAAVLGAGYFLAKWFSGSSHGDMFKTFAPAAAIGGAVTLIPSAIGGVGARAAAGLGVGFAGPTYFHGRMADGNKRVTYAGALSVVYAERFAATDVLSAAEKQQVLRTDAMQQPKDALGFHSALWHAEHELSADGQRALAALVGAVREEALEDVLDTPQLPFRQ